MARGDRAGTLWSAGGTTAGPTGDGTQMNALYSLLVRRMTIQTSRPTTGTPDQPLSPIRPGAFARWMAEMEGRTLRDGFATNEGIAAARPDAVPEPGWSIG